MTQTKQPKRKRAEETEVARKAGAEAETQGPPKKTRKTSESDLSDSKNSPYCGMSFQDHDSGTVGHT